MQASETRFVSVAETVDDSQMVRTQPPRERRGRRLHLGRRAPPRGDHFGRFVLLESLGEGAMGAVYRAFDPQLEREVALKIQHERRGGARARALTEARALARVDHPNVVEVYEVGEVGPDVYVVMELLHGCNLRAWIRAEERRPVEILRVFNDASHGLDALHATGLVHRDVKPDNIFVTDSGRVVMVDLGLAREMPRMIDSEALVLSGVAGTPAYMAPEQHRGKSATPASDQYSLAVALWEALFGSRPHVADDLAHYRELVLGGRLGMPGASRGLSRKFVLQLHRALAVDPHERYVSAGALLETLAQTMSEVEIERRAANVSMVLLSGGALVIPIAVGIGAKVTGTVSVVIGFAVMIAFNRVAQTYNPNGSTVLRQVSAVAHGFIPGMLFAAMAADLSFVEACASWFPPVIAVGIIGTLIETNTQRMWIQSIVVVVTLCAAWLMWGSIETGELPLFATTQGLIVRMIALGMIAVLFHGQVRRLERGEVFVEDMRFDRSAMRPEAS